MLHLLSCLAVAIVSNKDSTRTVVRAISASGTLLHKLKKNNCMVDALYCRHRLYRLRSLYNLCTVLYMHYAVHARAIVSSKVSHSHILGLNWGRG